MNKWKRGKGKGLDLIKEKEYTENKHQRIKKKIL